MKGLRKQTELPRTLNRCECSQKNGRQQKKPVTRGIRKKNKKLRTRSSECPNTKFWKKKLHQEMLAVSRI